MIHMSQIKISVGKIEKVSSAEMMKHSIISEGEMMLVKKEAARVLKISEKDISDFQIKRKSIDARKKDNIHFIYQVDFSCKNEQKILKRYSKNDAKYISDAKKSDKIAAVENKNSSKNIIIAGFGPAGLFAAYTLSCAGFCPTVIERGSDTDTRQKSVTKFWESGILDTECNVQFGEGGAGTFSDGKLNTLVKDTYGYNRRVLETFVEFGAPSEILYLQKPHIGTDRLKGVVKAMREAIIRNGGNVLFDTKLTDIIYEQNHICQIEISKKAATGHAVEKIPCDSLILATGHSARDTFYQLNEKGLFMQPKPFAVGVRVEHPQEMIGKNQYGAWYEKLPTADYKLTYTAKNGHGVYSFCMCPGGYVVNASSEEGRLAVNGMSDYARDGKNANSAIVVTVAPEDFGSTGALAGIEFQRKWEEAAYKQAGGKIPVQLLQDFKNNVKSTGLGSVIPQMKGLYELANVREILPKLVGDSIAESMEYFDRKIKGYRREDALLSGIESRTSSPVRISRDDDLQANIRGIYPCGEGAGYAGGIMSAAMDGIKVAERMIQHL